jgi:hypothetical protein
MRVRSPPPRISPAPFSDADHKFGPKTSMSPAAKRAIAALQNSRGDCPTPPNNQKSPGIPSAFFRARATFVGKKVFARTVGIDQMGHRHRPGQSLPGTALLVAAVPATTFPSTRIMALLLHHPAVARSPLASEQIPSVSRCGYDVVATNGNLDHVIRSGFPSVLPKVN